LYHRTVVFFGLVFVGIGFAVLVVTTVHGGGVVGYLLGALFIGLGAGRIALERRRLS
jgi:hypothetical protein